MAKMGLGRGLDLLIPKNEPKKAEIPANNTIETRELPKEDFIPEPIPEPVPVAEPVKKQEITEQKPVPQQETKDAEIPAENIVTLKISMVEPNRDQSRKTFDETSLKELSESIRQYGVIQPIVVCRKDDYYEIIAGERRWRASKMAGLKEIPVVIRDYPDKERAEVSLIENIQREDLNPIEEAAAYKQLIDEYDLTQENLAARVSKSRTAIANTMRLLKLNEDVQKLVIEGKLSGGHARALLAIEDPSDQLKAANRVIDNNLNVRQTEELVKDWNKPDVKPAKKRKKNVGKEKAFKELEGRMTEVLGTKVRIHQKEKGGGKIEISYFSDEELDRIYTSINQIRD